VVACGMSRARCALAVLALAAALVGACARDGKPGGEAAAVSRSAVSDLGWVDRLVEMLRHRATTRESLAVFFGLDSAAAASDGWNAVSRYGLASVRIYDLPHVEIDVAVEAIFAADSRPHLAELEARFGTGRALPRRPDDLSSGGQVAFHPENGSSPAYVRVFAELERDGSRVTQLQLDRSLLGAEPAGPGAARR